MFRFKWLIDAAGVVFEGVLGGAVLLWALHSVRTLSLPLLMNGSPFLLHLDAGVEVRCPGLFVDLGSG